MAGLSQANPDALQGAFVDFIPISPAVTDTRVERGAALAAFGMQEVSTPFGLDLMSVAEPANPLEINMGTTGSSCMVWNPHTKSRTRMTDDS
jgi:hypothetical protein